MMLSRTDLDAYLARIGYEGPREATRNVLATIQLKHVETIPFETIDSLTGRGPRLDLPAIMDKLVRSRRGGYCFEHNILFKAALESIGFAPVAHLARVLMGEPDGAETPRTHMLLRVEADGEDLIADAGFGGQVLTGPIRLAAGTEQDTPHEPYRLDHDGAEWWLRALVAAEWRNLYRFRLEPVLPIDCVVANHYVSTHPASYFTQALVAARILPGGRLTLRNRRVSEHRLGAATRTEEISEDAVLRDVLASRFGIEVDDDVWRETVRRIGSG